MSASPPPVLLGSIGPIGPSPPVSIVSSVSPVSSPDSAMYTGSDMSHGSISPPTIGLSQEQQTDEYIYYLRMLKNEEGIPLFEITENTEGGSGDKVYIINRPYPAYGYVLKVFQDQGDYMSELGNIQRFMDVSSIACGSYFTMEISDTVDVLRGDGGAPRPPDNSILGKFYSRVKRQVPVDDSSDGGYRLIELSPENNLLKALHYLRGKGHLNMEEFLRCLREVNKKEVFHRDIKYLNIIFMNPKFKGTLLGEPPGRYEEKLIHLIDYGSVIDLDSEIHRTQEGFELMIDGNITIGTTARNLFPLYLFLGDSRVQQNKYACSVILQANEIWQCILFLYEIYSGDALLINSRVTEYNVYNNQINGRFGFLTAPEAVYKCIFNSGRNIKLPNEDNERMITGKTRVPIPNIKQAILNWVLPEELFNPASIATVYNPPTEPQGVNVDSIIGFCERYIDWFDTHVEAIVKDFLGPLTKTVSGGFKKSRKPRTRKSRKSKSRKSLKSRKPRKSLKSRKSRKKTRRKRNR